MKRVSITIKTLYKTHNVTTTGFLVDVDNVYLDVEIGTNIIPVNEHIGGYISYGNFKVKFEGKIKEVSPLNDKREEITIVLSKIGELGGLMVHLSKTQEQVNSFMNRAKGLV